MATQPFVPGMPSLSTSCVTSTVTQQQQQQQQVKQSTTGHNSKQHVQVVTSSGQQQNGQGSNATTTTSQVAVVSHTATQSGSQPQSSQSQGSPSSQQSVVQTTSNGGNSTQFITVTAVSDDDSPSQATVALQPGHHAYVHYVDGNGDPAGLYANANGQMAGYSVYNVTDSATMYTPGTATYYSTGSGTAVSYSQVNTNVSQGVSIQGQILTHQGGGTYLVQGNALDGDSHPLSHATRASPATIHLMEENGTYKLQGTLIDTDNHHPLTSSASVNARISPVTEEIRKVSGGLLSSYSNDPCVIQTLHSSHEPAELQALAPQQQSQQQQQPTPPSQQQNVRDMDIIHCVQWLIDNYETAEGVSLPRSTLYSHYLRHCTEHKLEPVNAASFGKLIRSVFLGLRTRRLGTRGNSKYHYYGIRVKPTSPLNQIGSDDSGSGSRPQSTALNKRFKTSTLSKADLNDSNSDTANSTMGGHSGDSAQQAPTPLTQPTPQQQHHQQYLGDASTAIPSFVKIELERTYLPDGMDEDDVESFKNLYRELCESFLEAVVNLQFSLVEQLWQAFWRTHGNHSSSQNEQEKILSKSKLYNLCKCDSILQYVRKADYQFYQNLVDVLIPDVLRPIPSSLTQAIRNFAKSLEGWLTSAMSGCPDDMLKIKVSSVSAFAQTLRRYTSLNHLAQAARAVLQNSSQINQMLADLNRVDFHNVQEQASWVCQCEDGMVQRLEQDFKLTLQQQNSLEQWAAWLEGVVTLVLQPHEGKSDFPKAARQFLLKWSFYSSMVIRDLTLRSAASFGSFHLIRLLYDEYMFYLIEHKVAKATGETPIAVMGEFIGLGSRVFGNDPLSGQRLALALSSPGRNLVENGDSSSGGIIPTTQQNVYTITNGLKDVGGGGVSNLTSLQQGLIGQPAAVCISNDNSDQTLPASKKIKAA